ncbi:MAG TPA: 16S rRNA (uracil(1498)-N(3))-methyltransferase [Sediminispirochaeta sp.]|nr:16S rRNA (uracil(1498)-N(3))-methyltransferase [Sediminispirochaeta sp.]
MNIILFEDTPKYISLTDPRGRHIKRILKLQAGDRFRAGIVNGPVGEVEITDTDPGGYQLHWTPTGAPVTPYPLTLIIGFVRPISAKRILREAASLGVSRLVFTVTDTGERSYRRANLWIKGEYRDYLINGLQTAGATVMPEVSLCDDLPTAIAKAAPTETAAVEAHKFLLDNTTDGAVLDLPQSTDRPVILAVGSERGWSERERRIFTESSYRPVQIGRRVLRTETACSAGAALALKLMGYM